MKLEKEDYIVIPAFVVMSEEDGGLGLKGNDAIVYSIIYGFSKDGESWYQGSQSYLAAWCGCTRQGVQKNLNSLLEKGLIRREYVKKNGTTYVNYQSCHPANSVGRGGEQSLHHNIEHNITPSDIDTDVSISSPPKGEVEQIVDYLNAKTGKHFLATAKATQRKIKARLKEGRTVEDFMKVIDIKVKAWKGDPKWDKFLRPETLFSADHFDSYLNENPIEEPKPQPKQGYSMKRVTLEDFD